MPVHGCYTPGGMDTVMLQPSQQHEDDHASMHGAVAGLSQLGGTKQFDNPDLQDSLYVT